MAGDLDERCADAWDVEPDSDSEAPASPKRRRLAPMPPVAQPRAMEQGTGLAAVRHGVAGVWNFEPIALSLSDVTKCHAKKHISLDGGPGRIMRLWGGCPSATPSSTLLDCILRMDDVDAG